MAQEFRVVPKGGNQWKHMEIEVEHKRPVEFANIDDAKDSFTCGICTGAAISPMQASCGCRFCKKCLTEFEGTIVCPGGFGNCGPLSLTANIESRPKEDRAVRREMRHLKIVCPHGCGKILRVDQLFQHISSSSSFTPKGSGDVSSCHRLYCTACKNVDDIDTFHENHRLEICSFCKREIRLCQMKRHLDPSDSMFCPEYHGGCMYCGEVSPSTKTKALLSDRHRLICPKWPQACNYERLGCNLHHGMPDDPNDVKVHLELLMKHVIERGDSLGQRTDNESQQQEVGELAVNSLEEINKIKRTISLEKDADERISNVTTQCEESFSQILKTRNAFSIMDMVLSETPQSIKEKLPIAPYIWCIRNYLDRKRMEAVIDSPPFLTERYKYKLRMRLYFNGDGNGRGTHLSAYIILMPYDYDNLLKWPFEMPFVFTLIDQKKEGFDHRQIIHPNRSSRSFARPSREESDSGVGVRASGCSKYFPLERLEGTSRYLVDGSLYLKFNIV